MTDHSNMLPHFIEAKDKRALMRAMLQNNNANHYYFKYFDIQKDGTKWVAWYLKKVEVLGGS